MAQPSTFRIQYLGATEAKANIEYTAAGLITLFPDANAFILKTKNRDVPVKVSINSSVAFEIAYDEITAFDGTTALTYVFNQDCIIVAVKDLDVTP